MKKIAKSLSLFLVMILLVSTLGGCGSKKKDEQQPTSSGDSESTQSQDNSNTDFKGQTLKVAAFAGAYGTDFWDAVCKKFEDEYGVTVELTCSPQLEDIIRPSIVSGDPPDFIALAQEKDIITMMLKEDALLDLSDVVKGDIENKLLSGILDYCQPYNDGRILYTPSWYYSWGIWYNKNLMKEKGWELPKTMDEFLDLGAKAKKEGIALYTYPGVYPAYNQGLLFASLASAGGVDLLNSIANYEDGIWESDQVRSVLDVFQKMVDNGYILDGSVALTHTQAQTEFLQGKALFCVSGSWIEGEMADAAPEGFEYGFLPAPVLAEGQDQYANIGFETFEIPKDGENIALAKEFLKFLYRDDILTMNAELTKASMAVKGGADFAKEFLLPSCYENLKMLDDQLLPCFVNFTLTSNTKIIILDELFNSVNSLVNGDMNEDDWIARMEAVDKELRESVIKK